MNNKACEKQCRYYLYCLPEFLDRLPFLYFNPLFVLALPHEQ